MPELLADLSSAWTGALGARPVFEQVGDVALHLQERTTLDDRIVLLDYRPGGKPPYADEAETTGDDGDQPG